MQPPFLLPDFVRPLADLIVVFAHMFLPESEHHQTRVGLPDDKRGNHT